MQHSIWNTVSLYGQKNNILQDFVFDKKKESHTDLKWHEAEQLMTDL